ncbi:DNA primase [Lacticaseibacillus daqingensis]|uniref:DNA primase n=1 Tax=Lacticaseibacillus daqingensis TaxID=2486014 RepID=UPI000F77BC29|nr:DNA primase [Lacticaseibacillus daqingensis]
MIPNETIDTVRNTVNIADYIGQYVALHKQGQNLFGICPFHSENTPSFSVNESKQIFQCFSCGRGGNVFKFVMDYDKLTFPEAVAKVAEFANVPLGVTITSDRPQESAAVTRQKEILRLVTDLCHHVLVNTAGGEAALAYLTGRGLSDETIAHFEIGYLPKDRTILKKFLDSKAVDYDEQRATGLFVEDDQGHLYDRFVDRVMFPLKDAYGAVIGFSGRVLSKDGQQAKYLNSPETELFNKRDVLFNLDEAKGEFKGGGGATLFEGFMDVIAAYQAGVKTGIASMGTSLTQDQVSLIAHHTKRLTICYDGDAPGQHAADRALSLVQNHPKLTVGVVVLPDGQDPDEFIQARGADAFVKQLTHTLTPIGFRLSYLAADRDMTADQEKLAYIDTALKAVASDPDPVAQAVYLNQISGLTGVPTTALSQSLQNVRPTAPMQAAAGDFGPPPPEPEPEAYGGDPTAPPVEAVHYNRYEKAQRQLLQLAWHDPNVARRLHTQDFHFPTAHYQALYDAWLGYAKTAPAPDVAGFMDTLDAALMPLVAGIEFAPLPDGPDEAVDDLIARAQEESTVTSLDAIKQQLSQAQQLGDTEAVRKLTMQYFTLMRQIKTTQ